MAKRCGVRDFRRLAFGLLAGALIVPTSGASDSLSRRAKSSGTRLESKSSLPTAVLEMRGAVGPARRIQVQRSSSAQSGILPAGDELIIHKGDAFVTAPGFSHEGTIAASSCVAGGTDFLAFRFSTQDFAHELPVTITGVELGLDNLYGRTVWPLIAIVREDPNTPLQPGQVPLDSVVGFDLPVMTPTFPVPAGSSPDLFMRFLAPMPTGVVVSEDLTVDDLMWSDAFDRVDQPLASAAGDWVECDLDCCDPVTCPTTIRQLLIESGSTTKLPGGDALGAKLPAAAVHAIRPVEDLDVIVGVNYDLSQDPLAERAGIAARLVGFDQFYFAEYSTAGGSDRVDLNAMTPGGIVNLMSWPMATPVPTGRLEFEVTGVHPITRIEVSLNGTPLTPAYAGDSTYTYGGVLSGVVSPGASSGERWDDFTVERNPDYFAIVQFPVGETAALPAEYSSATVPFQNILASTDGVTYLPLATPFGCGPGGEPRPANSFVALQVRDDTPTPAIDNVFQRESKLTSLTLDCRLCPRGQNECSGNLGPAEALASTFEVGESVDFNLAWWNEHVPDESSLMFRVDVYQGATCAELFSLGLGAWLTGADAFPVDIGVVPGQGSGVVDLYTMTMPPLTFVPTISGSHCAVGIEFYDTNGDGCPDGWEGGFCPATQIQDPDENASTGVITRDFTVADTCSPGMSNLDHNTLFVAKDVSDRTRATLEWSSLSVPGEYNVHATEFKQQLADPTIRDEVPVWRRVVGGLTTTTGDLGNLCSGQPRYVVVFESDGCPSGRSLVDP